MMPGGHLATAVALSGAAYAATGSPEAAAGCFAGGFLIDVDHYLDYLVFERQWRRPGPISFLRYYFTNSPQKVVLPLHSMELMAILLTIWIRHPWPLLAGYWLGAAMHLTFDVFINGEYALKRAVCFYFFAFRMLKRFAAEDLMDRVVVPDGVGKRPVAEFFQWRPLTRKESQTPQIQASPPAPAAVQDRSAL